MDTRKSIWILFGILIAAWLLGSVTQVKRSLAMNPWKILLFKDIEWEDPPRGHYLTEVKQKVLWEDKNTGATLALVKFPEGVADKIHSHPGANQMTIGLSGEVEMPPNGIITRIQPDRALIIPKGEKHGATRFTKESIVLFFWDGSPKGVIGEETK